MGYFDWWYTSEYALGSKDPNSNSLLRGYEKRLSQLLNKEQTPRVIKEIKKLHKKIAAQKEKIRKQNDKAKRSQQQALSEKGKS